MTSKLYEQDFNLWIENTIQQLQNHKFDSLDIEHLIEELKDLSKSDKNTLESNLMILLTHLLKLKVQHDAPETMQGRWYNSIDEHRQRVIKQLEDTPSLTSYLDVAVDRVYSKALKLAIKESKRAKFGVRIPEESEYPNICPFDKEQLLNEDFYR